MNTRSKSSSFIFRVIRPFFSIGFWKLNLRTLQIKRLFHTRKERPYLEYLQTYYSREINPYYEQVEDKWFFLRSLIIDLAELSPGEWVLDLGTGVGFQAMAFATKGHKTFGADLIVDRLVLAKERHRHSNLHWLAADVRGLPLPDNSFDVVAVSLMLHDMPIPVLRSTLKEISRVARRRVVIAEPSLPQTRLFAMLYRLVVPLLDESLFLKEYLDTNMEVLFEEAGLQPLHQSHLAKDTLTIYVCNASGQATIDEKSASEG